jgi:hypothetical protein
MLRPRSSGNLIVRLRRRPGHSADLRHGRAPFFNRNFQTNKKLSTVRFARLPECLPYPVHTSLPHRTKMTLSADSIFQISL